jgi:hypothetical protein
MKTMKIEINLLNIYYLKSQANPTDVVESDLHNLQQQNQKKMKD